MQYRTLGRAIAGRRNDLVLATKAFLPMGDELNHRGRSRRWLITGLDASLRRLDVDHGLTMIELALGFVTAHPGHLESQLAAADTALSADLLDAIDAIVAPGMDLSPAEKIDARPSITDTSLRRR